MRRLISERRINSICQQVLREAIGDPIDNKEHALRLLNSIYHSLGADAQSLRPQFEQLYQAIEGIGSATAAGNGGGNAGGNGGYAGGNGGGYAGGNGGGYAGGNTEDNSQAQNEPRFEQRVEVPEGNEPKVFTFEVMDDNGSTHQETVTASNWEEARGILADNFGYTEDDFDNIWLADCRPVHFDTEVNIPDFDEDGSSVSFSFDCESTDTANGGDVRTITVVANSLEEAIQMCIEEARNQGMTDIGSIVLVECASAFEDVSRDFVNNSQPRMTSETTDQATMYDEVMRQLRGNQPCKFVFRKVDGSVRPAVGTLNREWLEANVGDWEGPRSRNGANPRQLRAQGILNFNQNYYDLTDGAFKRFNPTRLLAVY